MTNTVNKSQDSSKINVEVKLDTDRVPESIRWQADDSPFDGMRDCKSFMISLWDKKDSSTLRIDLWTKEMRIDEMNAFFYQTLMTMADTYSRATNNQEMANEMKNFGNNFGKKTNVIK